MRAGFHVLLNSRNKGEGNPEGLESWGKDQVWCFIFTNSSGFFLVPTMCQFLAAEAAAMNDIVPSFHVSIRDRHRKRQYIL